MNLIIENSPLSIPEYTDIFVGANTTVIESHRIFYVGKDLCDHRVQALTQHYQVHH